MAVCTSAASRAKVIRCHWRCARKGSRSALRRRAARPGRRDTGQRFDPFLARSAAAAGIPTSSRIAARGFSNDASIPRCLAGGLLAFETRRLLGGRCHRHRRMRVDEALDIQPPHEGGEIERCAAPAVEGAASLHAAPIACSSSARPTPGSALIHPEADPLGGTLADLASLEQGHGRRPRRRMRTRWRTR